MLASMAFWRAMRAAHQPACSLFAASGHFASASRGISHSAQVFFSAASSLHLERSKTHLDINAGNLRRFLGGLNSHAASEVHFLPYHATQQPI